MARSHSSDDDSSTSEDKAKKVKPAKEDTSSRATWKNSPFEDLMYDRLAGWKQKKGSAAHTKYVKETAQCILDIGPWDQPTPLTKVSLCIHRTDGLLSTFRLSKIGSGTIGMTPRRRELHAKLLRKPPRQLVKK